MSQRQNYEDHFFYRLVKVAYVVGSLIIGFLIIVIGWTYKPTEFTDGTKSYLACSNGKKYSLETAKIIVWSNNKTLNSYADKEARKVCAYSVVEDYSDKYPTPQYKNYTLNLVNGSRGSWWIVLLVWTIGLSLLYAILNIFRETLLYMVLGKKFSWEWLEEVLTFIGSSH
jgi:hypothetical protein